MKHIKKLLTPFAWTLDKLYILRTQHGFLTSSEVRKILAANDTEKFQLQTSIKAFSDSVIQLVHARCKLGWNGYDLNFHVSKDALTTPAGEQLAVSKIALELAKLILDRHHKSEQNKAKKNKPQTL